MRRYLFACRKISNAAVETEATQQYDKVEIVGNKINPAALGSLVYTGNTNVEYQCGNEINTPPDKAVHQSFSHGGKCKKTILSSVSV